MHLQTVADGRMREFQIEISLPALRCLRVAGVNSQLRHRSPRCANRKRAGRSFITKTYWKSSWEKDHSSTGGKRSPERCISPAFTHSDKALSLTALSFLPPAYFIWLSFNGFLWITSLCFHCIFVLIKIQCDMKSSSFWSLAVRRNETELSEQEGSHQEGI